MVRSSDGRIFLSPKDAALFYKVDLSNICRACKNPKRSVRGFYLSYTEMALNFLKG